jgi:phosphatidylserine/phosphatidylglycerophosphate/cardiolipin synthase-like enzyme
MPDTVDKTLSGADRRITVSVLDPGDWFAPFGRPPTEGNLVTALVDGRRTMAEMDRAFLGSTFVYLTGWEIQDEVRLRRAPRFRRRRLFDVLERAIQGGSRVRVLQWAGSSFSGSARPDPANPTAFLDTEVSNARTATDLQRMGAQAVLDDRGQTVGAQPATFLVTSHHVKMAVADGGGQGMVGFCGGIDIALGRWDHPGHVADDPQRDPAVAGPFLSTPPWHDVHAMVRGPAARHLEANFVDRWNDLAVGETLFPGIVVPAAAGPHVVQVVRTIGAGNYAFAPDGEFGILATYLLAVGQARRYIYLENQYFVSEVLVDALIEAMQRNADTGRDFRIILVLPRLPMEAGTRTGDTLLFHQTAQLRRLRAADPGGMFAVYFPHQPVGARDIFVHAKVAIVDDVWATIGSANTNRRGFCFDSELNLAVIDTEVVEGGRRFARDLRLELWQEHLGLADSAVGTIEDPIAGAAVWEAREGSFASRVREFNEEDNPGDDRGFWDTIIDPVCEDDVPELEAP